MKKQLLTFLALGFLAVSPVAAKDGQFGTVSFKRCLDESKFGKQEQGALEAMSKNIAGMIEQTENQLRDLQQKVQDPDFVDSLSPEAEKDLQVQFQTLQQQRMAGQNQYYQMMQQGEMKLMQGLTVQVMRASQVVAKAKSLDWIARDDSLFYFQPSADITDAVIKEMDKLFEKESQESN